MKLSLSIFNSNKDKKTIILKIVTFIVLLAITGYSMGFILEFMHKRNIVESYDSFVKAKRWSDFYSQQRDINALFIGSSHSYVSYDPEIFNNKLGINSFNFGTPSQQPDMGYYLLKEVLNHSKPNLVVYDVFWARLENESGIAQVLFNYEFIKKSENKDEIFDNLFSTKDKFEYFFKVLRYRLDLSEYMNRLINSFVGISNKENEYQYKSKGFVFSEKVVDPLVLAKDKTYAEYKFKGLNKTQTEYLEKTIELCRSNNISLLLVTSPLPPTILNQLKNNYANIYLDIKKIADNYNIEYVDLNLINEKKNIVTDANFADNNHLNYSGAEIVSNYLSEHIRNKGNKYIKK